MPQEYGAPYVLAKTCSLKSNSAPHTLIAANHFRALSMATRKVILLLAAVRIASQG